MANGKNRLLASAIAKYGEKENVASKRIPDKDWEKCTYEEEVSFVVKDKYALRNLLMPQGRILEEDMETMTYIMLVTIKGFGKNEVLLVANVKDSVLSLAAYAKEGLIRQNLSRKAVKQVIDSIK